MRRALVVDGTGAIGLEERPALTPGPGEVVVRPAYCGLCGTDLELLRGEVDAGVRPLSRSTLGHEWSGVVEAVGEGVTGHRARDALRRRGDHPVRALRELPDRRDECLRDLRRDRLHAGGRRRRPGRRSGARRARPRATTCRCSTPRSSSRRRSSSPGSRRPRPRPGLRVLDRRRRDDRAARGAPRPLCGRRPSSSSPGRRPEQEELALALGATTFTTGPPPTGFDLAVEAAGATAATRGGDRLPAPRRHRAAARDSRRPARP